MKYNDRIKMESYHGVLYCEACINDEVTVADIEYMVNEINENYHGQSDVILNKSGSYSVSSEAQIMLFQYVKEFRNFVYIADTSRKKVISEYAAKSYMKSYNTKVATSKKEAYEILKAMA